MSGNYNCFVISCFFFFIVSNTNMSGNYNADGSDNIRIELCEVCGSMSGMFALIGGKFHFDWSDMRVVGICKILCD